MGKKELMPSTDKEAQAAYRSTLDFDNGNSWKLPSYSWSAERTETLNMMPVTDMAHRLEIMIGSRQLTEDLHKSYSEWVSNRVASYHEQVKSIDDNFEQYKYLKRHPNEEAYRRTHGGEFFDSQAIDYTDTKISVRGIIIAVVLFLLTGRYRSAAYQIFAEYSTMAKFLSFIARYGVPLLFIVSVLFYFFAKEGYSFSQPWSAWQGNQLAQNRQRIENLDKIYRQEHDCSDKFLEREFKYNASLQPINSIYVIDLKNSKRETEDRLKQYNKITLDNVVYFPPFQTKDINHLIGIYGELLKGVPTWKQALEHVSQDERYEQMTNSITEAIQMSSDNIIRSIDQATEKITDGLDKMNKNLDELEVDMIGKTSAIHSWGKTQSEIALYQTAQMQQVNANVNQLARRYRN